MLKVNFRPPQFEEDIRGKLWTIFWQHADASVGEIPEISDLISLTLDGWHDMLKDHHPRQLPVPTIPGSVKNHII